MRGNHSILTLNGDPQDEMVSDLLNLSSALRAENDLPKVTQETLQKTSWIKKREMRDLFIASP